jgi:hypothetical protein
MNYNRRWQIKGDIVGRLSGVRLQSQRAITHYWLEVSLMIYDVIDTKPADRSQTGVDYISPQTKCPFQLKSRGFIHISRNLTVHSIKVKGKSCQFMNTDHSTSQCLVFTLGEIKRCSKIYETVEYIEMDIILVLIGTAFTCFFSVKVSEVMTFNNIN